MTVTKQNITFDVICDSCLHTLDVRFDDVYNFDLMEELNKRGWKTIFPKGKKARHVCNSCYSHYKIVRSFVESTEEDDETTDTTPES